MIPLKTAQRIANHVREELSEFCTQIEIAGSVRRLRPVCGDIDIVLEPIPGKFQELKERILNQTEFIRGGDSQIVVQLPRVAGYDVQLDFYFATPATNDLIEKKPRNFGSLLLCRTGSKEHNIYIAKRALELGLNWSISQGLLASGRVVASETEQSIFDLLGLPFIQPQDRER